MLADYFRELAPQRQKADVKQQSVSQFIISAAMERAKRVLRSFISPDVIVGMPVYGAKDSAWPRRLGIAHRQHPQIKVQR